MNARKRLSAWLFLNKEEKEIIQSLGFQQLYENCLRYDFKSLLTYVIVQCFMKDIRNKYTQGLRKMMELYDQSFDRNSSEYSEHLAEAIKDENV